MDNLIKIGTIENYWSWEYDTSIVTATLSFDPKDGFLLLDIGKVHIKSGLGKGKFRSHIGDYNVGTLKKPMKGKIGAILKENKQLRPFSRQGWATDDKNGLTLKELFLEIYEGDNDIARALKLSELKKRIDKTK